LHQIEITLVFCRPVLGALCVQVCAVISARAKVFQYCGYNYFR